MKKMEKGACVSFFIFLYDITNAEIKKQSNHDEHGPTAIMLCYISFI